MSKRIKVTHSDPETHSKHLKRQLESLEKDNHQSINDLEGLISIALSAQEEEGKMSRFLDLPFSNTVFMIRSFKERWKRKQYLLYKN